MPAPPLVYAFLGGLGSGAVVGALLYRVMVPPTILQPDPDESDYEDDDEDEQDGEPPAPAVGQSGYRDFGVLHAPFKMVLCVNQSLAMGKGKLRSPRRRCISSGCLIGYNRGLAWAPQAK